MDNLDRNDIEDIIKEYLKDNLSIETKEENDFGDKYVTISIKLGKEKISWDRICISNNND